jgi:hypothetical protein
MRALLQIMLLIAIGAAPVITAKADGLVPCDSREAGLVEDLSEDSKGSDPGEAVLSFLDLPGLWTGWGFQIVRSHDRFLLRTVQFRRDMRGGIVELRPGVFGANPVQPDPLVRTVSISRSLAERLSAVAIAEIAKADQANARMGFDGETYYFYAEGKCAFAWSPGPGTRPERLADIFQDLKTQGLLPTRLVQLFWEKRIVARLNHYTGSATMPLYQYLFVMAAGVAVVVVAALPLLIAWIVTLIPKRLQRKFHFVLVSGALSYGFTCFLAVLLLPFLLLGSAVAAQFDVDGHSDLAFTLDVIVKYSMYVLLNAGLVFAIAVPIYLRRKWWSSLIGPKVG